MGNCIGRHIGQERSVSFEDISFKNENDSQRTSKNRTNVDQEEQMNKLEEWKKRPLKFGTIGRSGMGKSTFINTILGKNNQDDDLAKTGCGDTTMEVKQYIHPKCDKFSIWDTPGFGTLYFTKKMFKKKVDIKSFDFLFIFIDKDFTEDEQWIAKKVTRFKIPFCFIRSNLDKYLDHYEDTGMQPKALTEQLRARLESDMKKINVLKQSEIFLISNIPQYFRHGDWGNLIRYIADKIQTEKVDSLLFFLPLLTPDTIQIKYEGLIKRIGKVSKIAGIIAAAIPIPLIDVAINLAIVLREIRMYNDVFGLNTEFAEEVVGKRDTTWQNAITNGLKLAVSSEKIVKEVLKSQLDSIFLIVRSVVPYESTEAVVASYLLKSLNDTRENAMTVYKRFSGQ